MPWGGHPQGAPLPFVFSPRYSLGRAPTRGAPTYCLLSALCPGEGTHKGRPYLLSSLRVMPWGGHPQGAPLPIVFSPRYALGRAPTRGASTRFRQPHVVLSQFDAIALGKHQGIGVSEKHLRSPHSGWLFCLVANRRRLSSWILATYFSQDTGMYSGSDLDCHIGVMVV